MNGLAVYENYHSPSIFPSHVVFDKKKIAGAAIAISTIAMATLTYQYPFQLTLAAIGATCISIYSLPKLMASRLSPAWVSTAFAITCTVWGSLLCGLASVFSYGTFREIINHCKASPLQIEKTLMLGIICTGLLGYLQWLSVHVLKRAYATFVDSEWKNQLSQMNEIWKKLRPLKWLSLDRFKLLFCLIFPHQAPHWMLERHWSFSPDLLSRISTLISIPELFKATLKTMREYQLYYGEYACPTEYKESLHALLKSTIEAMEDKEREKAFYELKESIGQLVPFMLSSQQFLDLFLKDQRYDFRIQLRQFLHDIKPFSSYFMGENPYEIRYLKMMREAHQLMDSSSSLDIETFAKNLANLKSDLIILREEISSLCKIKQEWKALYNAFPLSSEEEAIFENDNLIHLNEFYKKLLTDETNSLVGLINNLSLRLEQRESRGDQSVLDLTETYIFLSSHCNFKASENLIHNDYEDLRQWLQIESMHEIQETLEKEPYCLKTAEDLYAKKILPRPGPSQIPLTKSEIKSNLKRYIEECLATPSQTIQSPEPLPQTEPAFSLRSSLLSLSHRVSKLIFRLTMAGLIFVPLYLNPVAGYIGFGFGLIFFIVKRISEHRYRHFHQLIFANRHQDNFQFIYPAFANRRLILLTPAARRRMNEFAEADFFAKMRLLNFELLITLFIEIAADSHISVPERLENERGMGAVMQGLALADETLDIVISGWNAVRRRL